MLFPENAFAMVSASASVLPFNHDQMATLEMASWRAPRSSCAPNFIKPVLRLRRKPPCYS
jgi:hypothetical protein